MLNYKPNYPIAMLLVWLGTNCPAQNFCQPGARWTFTNYGMTYLCDVRGTITCNGEVFVHGRMATELHVAAVGNMCYDGPLTTHSYPIYYAMEAGDVMTWTGAAWDTLYRFNAVPGDRWYAPGVEQAASAYCDPEENHFVVIDTNRTEFNGVPVQQFTLLQYRDNDPAQPVFTTISERYQYPLFTPEIICNVIICGWYVPCSYSDDEIGEVDLATAPYSRSLCDQAWNDVSTNVDEIGAAGAPFQFEGGFLVFYGTIGTERITVDLLDGSGRLIRSDQTRNAPYRMDVSDLTAGVYLVRTVDPSTSVQKVQRFVLGR